MKYTGGILGVIAALVLSAGAASGQTTPARVSLADTVRTALPGSLISYVFTIELPDGEGGNAELSLPAHWRALTGGGELPRGSRRISYLVATSVPPSAAPGRYRIELAIRRLADTYRAAGWIIVPARHSLTLSAMESPDMVIGGSPIHGRFLLTNRGNARASVRVRIRSAQLSSVDSMHLELAAGASREIPVDLRTDPRIGTLIQSVTTAYAEEIGLPAEVARASFRVSIAPRETYAAAPTHSIGSRLRMIGTSTPGKGSGFEVSGAGFLRDGSTTRVEYIGRRIAGGHSLFGDRDEYRASVESRAVTLQVGDQIHRLSALSENGRYARGARAELRSKGWTLGGFVNRQGSLPSKPTERALFLNRDFDNGLTAGVNFLDRKEPDGGAMLTANATLRSLPIGIVEAEAGQAINSASPIAWMMSARGDFTRFNYSIFSQSSDRHYPGSMRGTKSTNAFMDARPLRGIRLRASINDQTRTGGRSTRDSSVAHHWNRTGGVTFRDRFTLELVQNGRDDWSFFSQPQRDERLANVIVRGKIRRVSLSGSAALGVAQERNGIRKNLERYTASAAFRPGKRTSLSANIQALRGGTLFNPEQRSELSGGMNASFDGARGSRFSVSAYATERRLVGQTRDATLEGSWEQQLWSGHQFSLRARLHRNPVFPSPDDNVVRAEYTMPFGLRVGHSRSRGRVSGRLHDVETGAAIPGATVQLGSQVTMTDAKGRFAFSIDNEMPVMLNLGGSGAAGLVSVRELPLPVVPRIGHTSSFDIAMTRAARIEGKVRLFIASPGVRLGDGPPPEEDSLGLRGARLELSKDGDIRRTVSNGRGEFVFTDLPPGRWSLTLDARDLPQLSYVEGDSVVLEVTPGQRVTTGLTVLPRKRKITIVHGG